jgi:hypothetical protein
MAASSCDNFSPGKVTTIASAMDLLRALRPWISTNVERGL